MTNLDEMMPDRGPSARFPRLSASVALEALLLASDAVMRHTDRWIAALAALTSGLRDARHVTRLYDLRTRGEDWKCERCDTRSFVPVPGDIDRRWALRTTREEAAVYAQCIATFCEAHARCEVP